MRPRSCSEELSNHLISSSSWGGSAIILSLRLHSRPYLLFLISILSSLRAESSDFRSLYSFFLLSVRYSLLSLLPPILPPAIVLRIPSLKCARLVEIQTARFASWRFRRCKSTMQIDDASWRFRRLQGHPKPSPASYGHLTRGSDVKSLQ
jgi:hypothetical protein